MRSALLTIVVGLVVYVVAGQLIESLVTGTGTGDTLNKMGAYVSNLIRKLRYTVNANLAIVCQRRDKLVNEARQFVETIYAVSTEMLDNDIVHPSMKILDKVHPGYSASKCQGRYVSNCIVNTALYGEQLNHRDMARQSRDKSENESGHFVETINAVPSMQGNEIVQTNMKVLAQEAGNRHRRSSGGSDHVC
jgi:hypothetical protein